MFSISWARIYPFGVAGSPLNQQGLDHYSDGVFLLLLPTSGLISTSY